MSSTNVLQPPDSAGALAEEGEDYYCRHLAEHFFECREFDELFQLIEKGNYLIEQADYFAGFGPSSRTIESYVLPAAVKKEDWLRFVRYAAIGANLRSVAESLGSEPVVQALMRAGYADFAQDIADQIQQPAGRARIRAAIAAALRDEGSGIGPILDQIREDLDCCPPPRQASEAQEWSSILQTVSRHLACELADLWAGWLGRIEQWPAPFQDAAAAVADGLLQGGPLDGPRLWQALSALGDPRRLAKMLPGRLVQRGIAMTDPFLARVEESLPDGSRLAWRIRVALLSAQPDLPAGMEPQAWRKLGESIPWSIGLAEEGRRLWGRLSDERLAQWLTPAQDPAIAAAVRVTRLEERRQAGFEESALHAVNALQPGPGRLHWSLRLLAAWPHRKGKWLGRAVDEAADCLCRLRYQVPADDLCRFLNLLAEIRPRQLSAQLKNCLWAPASSPATLRIFARQGDAPLLSELLASTEACAAGVSKSEADAFGLRREIIVTAASRLCALTGMDAFEQALQMLMPEEEDELRFAVARLQLGSWDEVIAAIRSGPLRLHAQLMQAQGYSDDVLMPEALYQSMASAQRILDECRSLGALHVLPLEPLQLAQRHLTGVLDPARQLEALADLARHSLRFEEERFIGWRQDRQSSILPLSDAQVAPGSEKWLAGFALELAELGAQADRSMALIECQEAAACIAGLDSVSWPFREDALVLLLSRLEAMLIGGCSPSQSHFRMRCRRAAQFIGWAARLPLETEAGRAGDELRENWHRLLPWIAAALDRLPWQVRGRLEHPLRWSLCATAGLAKLLGWQKAWRLTGGIGRRLSPGRRRERGFKRWKEGIFEGFAKGWEDLGGGRDRQGREERSRVLKLCRLPHEDRISLTATPEDKPLLDSEIRTLTILLTGSAPQRVPGLIQKLAPGAERDRLVLQLIQGDWLGAPHCESLLGMVSESSSASLAEAWLGIAAPQCRDERSWLSALAHSASHSGLDPANPVHLPLRRRLWQLRSGKTLPMLASCAIEAIRISGRQAGEQALCLFLNAYLAPTLGKRAAPAVCKRGPKVEAASRQALSLVGLTNGKASQPEAGRQRQEKQSHRLERIYDRWKAANKRRPHAEGQERPLGETRKLGLVAGMLLAFFLIPLDMQFFPMGDGAAASAAEQSAALGRQAWLLLAALWLCNAWTIDRFLSWRCASELRFKPWLRALRFLLAGIPVAGYWAIPFWRRIESHPPAWSLKEDWQYPVPSLSSAGSRPPARLKRLWQRGRLLGCHVLESHWGLAGWLMLNFAIPFMLLTQALPSPSRHHASLLIAGGILHLVAFACVASTIWFEVRQARLTGAKAWLRRSLPLLWLFPAPGLALLGVLVYVLSDLVAAADQGKRSLVRQALAAAGQIGKMPLWLRLEQRMHKRKKSLQDSKKPREGIDLEDRMVIWLYRIKAVALFAEGAWLARLVENSGLYAAQSILAYSALPLFGLGCLGLLIMVWRFFRRPSKDSIRKTGSAAGPRYAPYLAGTQFSLLAGILAGSALAAENPALAGTILSGVGVLGATICILPLLAGIIVPTPEEADRKTRERISWTFFFIGVASLGQGLDPENSSFKLTVASLQMLLLLGPVFSVLAGAAFLHWLVRPFHPRDTSSRQVDGRLRKSLAFMTGAALLPLGGLAIPLCMRLRQRSWPEYRRKWAHPQDDEETAKH